MNDIRLFRKALRMIEREIAILMTSETACCGISLPKCHALMELDSAGSLKLSELSSALGLDKSTLSRTVDALEDEKFIERKTDDGDARAVNLSLSDRGRSVVEKIHSSCDSYYDEILSGFPPEKRSEAVSIFCTIAEKMEAMKNRSGCCGIKRRK